MEQIRPTWHQYFMEMAVLVSRRSTCLRRKVGAVIVKNNQVISTGYNGSPKHLPHCSATGCLREQLKVPSGERHELCRGVHAEQNAIIQAAINGTTLKDSILYCTNQPCSICTKLLINAEIKAIYIADSYHDELAERMLEAADIIVYKIDVKTGDIQKII
jgi:dCMP deaminase